MNHLKKLETTANSTFNKIRLKRLARYASNIATSAANVLNNSAQLTALRRKAANIQNIETRTRTGKRTKVGRFTVSNSYYTPL